MNLKPLNSTCRTLRPKATLTILAAAFALGAALAGSARAEQFTPDPTVPGGIQVRPTNWFTITSNSPTLNYQGLQAPYMVQVTTNGGASWDNAGITYLKHPNFSGSTTLTNPGLYRLMLLGGTNWVGKWNPGALAVSNVFVGSGKCNGCHGDTVTAWSGTAHARAKDAIFNADGSFKPFRNDSCVACHVVGKNQPGGFLNMTNTAQLANVQCESCHGSANAHVNISGRTYHPVNTLAPELCGTCHTDNHHPTYDEYEETKHAEVNDDIKYGLANGVYYTNTIPNPTNPAVTWYGFYVTTNSNGTLRTNQTTGIIHSLFGPANSPIYDPGQDRAVGCGICHSAAARHAMLIDYRDRKAGMTNVLAMPKAADAGEWTATCVTCHDPHSTNNVAQLRNPISSTNFYTMPTTADKRTTYSTNLSGKITTNVFFMSAAFANMYNPSVQICGQCHNSRGARWDGRSYGYYNTNTLVSSTVPGANIAFGVQTNISYSRPPHHSPQYNILSGILQPDYLGGTNILGVHSLAPDGCASCHMASVSVATPTDQNPNYTGHEFEPLLNGYNACVTCHAEGATTVSNRMAGLQAEISGGISSLVTQLNNWATTKGPALFGANYSKYLQNGWEYTTPGAYATITNAGPSSSDQLKIPAGVRQARYNLYMVGYGNSASLGVHNPQFTRFLLNDASNKVATAISGP
jgi:hypothetical protein